MSVTHITSLNWSISAVHNVPHLPGDTLTIGSRRAIWHKGKKEWKAGSISRVRTPPTSAPVFSPISQRAQRGFMKCCKAPHFTVRIRERLGAGVTSCYLLWICSLSVPKNCQGCIWYKLEGGPTHGLVKGDFHTGRQPLWTGLEQGDGLSDGTSHLAHRSPSSCALGT